MATQPLGNPRCLLIESSGPTEVLKRDNGRTWIDSPVFTGSVGNLEQLIVREPRRRPVIVASADDQQ